MRKIEQRSFVNERERERKTAEKLSASVGKLDLVFDGFATIESKTQHLKDLDKTMT